MTIIIPKHVAGVYTYADYSSPAKVSGRLAELTDANPAQVIRRTFASDPVAVLVKKSWYDGRVAAYAAVQAAPFEVSETVIRDDYVGDNFALLVCLLLNKPEAYSNQAARFAAEASSNLKMRIYVIENTKGYYAQEYTGAPVGTEYGGADKAYLISYGHYKALEASPQATVFVGAGNGTIAPVLSPGYSVVEDIVLTCTAVAVNGGTFSVVGSVSGPLGNATVGTLFESSVFKCLISDGAVDFVLGDVFTVKSVAAILV